MKIFQLFILVSAILTLSWPGIGQAKEDVQACVQPCLSVDSSLCNSNCQSLYQTGAQNCRAYRRGAAHDCRHTVENNYAQCQIGCSGLALGCVSECVGMGTSQRGVHAHRSSLKRVQSCGY